MAGYRSAPVWEQRWHPLREEWIIVAAHRQNRPWSGMTVARADQPPRYSPDCFLCPGNARVGGHQNPPYDGTFVFDNDHPCVAAAAPPPDSPPFPFRVSPASGVARVVCYSSAHDLSLARLSVDEIDALLQTWQSQYVELSGRPEVNQVLIFENRGEAVGVSNPHPHCQIYATSFVFKHIEAEARVSASHLREHGSVLFQDIISAERAASRRILYENESAIVFVPWFARYAYEAFVAPKKSHADISTLAVTERRDLADAIKRLVVRYDNLWRLPFPYVMVLHQAPADGTEYDGFHFHLEFHPPLRKPNLVKHLAGPEIGGGNFVADTNPDETASELKGVSDDVHYLEEV